MLRKIFIGIIFLSLCNTAFAQDEIIPVSSAEKFNKRGIYNNGDLNFNGKEIISDYDGNLMIKYSTPVNISNDLGSELTIIYNANVEHRCFIDGPSDGYSINTPEWIIGYKGFALQTLNFETNYLINFITQDSPQDIPLLIPGYHFSNKINLNDNSSKDYITILRADGSKLILENSETQKDTGLYIEKGINTYGFAIVKGINAVSRNIYYKPGDGLTYVFEESINKLGGDTTTLRSVYLKKIMSADTFISASEFSSFREVTFQYEFYGNYFNNSTQNGRKILTSISSSATLGNNEVDFIWSFQNNICSINIYNNNSNDNLTLLAYPYPGNIFDITQDNSLSRILSINEIKDKSNRSDTFDYYGSGDNVTLRKYRVGIENIDIFYNSLLLKELVTYSGKKFVYGYCQQVFDSLLEDFPNPEIISLNFSLGDYAIYQNIDITGRDCFTNFMLKNRNVYAKQNSLLYHVLEETYEYYKVDSLGNRTADGTLPPLTSHGIITAITTKDKIGTDNSARLIIKNFSRYSAEKILSFVLDAGSTIRLMNEKIYGGNLEDYQLVNVNTYNYDLGEYLPDPGTPSRSFWSGTFTELEETTTKYAADNSNFTTRKYRTVDDIQFEELNFFISEPGFPIYTKKIVKSEKWYDSKSLIIEKSYYNYLSSENPGNLYTNTELSYFHKINLPETERIYSTQGITRSYTKHNYFSQDDLFRKGRLESIIYGVNGVTDTVEYSYWLDPSQYNYGLPYLKKTSRGITQEYLYSTTSLDKIESSIISSAQGTIVDYVGNLKTQTFTHSGFSLTPFSTTIKFNNGFTLGSFITANNTKEKPDFEIDLNGYYTKYEYDENGRLTKAVLPGNYQKEIDGFDFYEYNPITIIYNDNASGQFPLNIVEKKWLSGSKFLETQIEFDSFGRQCKTSVKNDAGSFEKKSLKEFDYLGRVVKETQGDSYTHYNYYNIVGDLLNVTNADGSVKTNTYHYGPGTIDDQTYYVQITATDETGKTKTSYYDQVGNLVAEQFGSNNPTLFYYDSIYRLTKVKTPEGIETTYQYDQNSNVIYKHSPDFGTYRYAYDRFNRLRFQLHVESQEFVFNNYDPLDRLLYTGVINNYSESSFNTLNADNTYSFENDANNLVAVNQYDSFVQSGVFVNSNLPQSFTYENPKGRLTASAYRDIPGQEWDYKLYSYDHLGRIKDQFLVE
ncbi:MAG: RHS repeat domain-containing protein [Bacteroidota bacterium]